MDDECRGPANVICVRCFGVVESRCGCPVARWCECGGDAVPWDEAAEVEKLERTGGRNA